MIAAQHPEQGFRLDDRVAIVTGASSGLGAQFARVLSAAGARVVLVARRLDRLEALAGELRDATALAIDLADDGAAEQVVDHTLATFERVDVLVNNAGVTSVAPANPPAPDVSLSTATAVAVSTSTPTVSPSTAAYVH